MANGEPLVLQDEFNPQRDLQLLANGAKHIISKSNPFQKEELVWANHLLENPSKADAPLWDDILPLVLKFNQILSWRTNKRGDKKEAIEAIQSAAQNKRASTLILDHMLLIADEWHTNAERCLREAGTGEILIDLYHSERSFWLFVRDNHGRLNIPDLLTRIIKAYQNGVLEVMERKSDGAGIGSFLAFRSSVSWLAAVRPNKETVLGARLMLDRNHENIALTSKNIHLPRGV